MSDPALFAPYAWLSVGVDDPDWWMQEACLFTFVHGISARTVADRLHLPVQEIDLSTDHDAARRFMGGGAAVLDEPGGWSVLYEDNGIPQDSAYQLATGSGVDEAVSVFTNVNSVMEFSYWQHGQRLVRFEFPDERDGTSPDALLSQMERTTGVTVEDYDRAMNDGTYLARMMALAQRITSVHLPKNFLQRPLLARLPS